jgi:hypothetical protein
MQNKVKTAPYIPTAKAGGFTAHSISACLDQVLQANIIAPVSRLLRWCAMNAPSLSRRVFVCISQELL